MAWRPSGLVVVQVRSGVMNSVVVVLPFTVVVLVSLVWEKTSFSSASSATRVVQAVIVRPEGVVRVAWAIVGDRAPNLGSAPFCMLVVLPSAGISDVRPYSVWIDSMAVPSGPVLKRR